MNKLRLLTDIVIGKLNNNDFVRQFGANGEAILKIDCHDNICQ